MSFDADSYFATQPPPPTLQSDIDHVRAFVQRQQAEGRNVVLVTSGGTTVPLELNVVRFLDNFSAGTRGATSAEYFLKAGYAVIFMHRQFSLQPFSRHYSHSTNPFLDFLQIEPPSPSSSGDDPEQEPRISVLPAQRKDLLQVLTAYKQVHAQGTLHTLTFVTVNDYLWLLRAVSQELAVLKRKAMFYLAAAVSDFFLPRQKLSEHKIQSGKGSLSIEMDQVPKVLGTMVDEWSVGAYIVSFKLETDQNLLLPKARQALERYGHQVVIGNDLHRRKFEVVFVSKDHSSPSSSSSSSNTPSATATSATSSTSSTTITTSPDGFTERWLRIDIPASDHHHHPAPGETVKEIEEDIVRELVGMHKVWIEAGEV